MQLFQDVFACCRRDIHPEPEVTIHLTRRRPLSQNNRTARIQRSLPKKNHLEISTKHSQNATGLRAPLPNSPCSRSKQSKNSNIEHSFTISERMQSPKSTSRESSQQNKREELESYQGYRDSFQKFINYGRMGNENQQNQKWRECDKLQVNIGPSEVKMSAPRLLVERRARKAKEQEANYSRTEPKQTRRQLATRRSPFVASVLETIDERLSLLSCTESQVHDINILHSKSIFLPAQDSIEYRPEVSLSAEKFTSCVMQNDNMAYSGLKMVKSENMQKFEENMVSNHEHLIDSKIRIDMEIYENQLKSLLEEEKYLLDQVHFAREQYHQRIKDLEKTKQELLAKLKGRRKGDIFFEKIDFEGGKQQA